MSKTKSGIVMEIKNNKACIMTRGGEFVNVKIGRSKPEVGGIYTGESIINMPSLRNIAVAASLVLFLLTGTAAYAYSIPVATVTLSSPSVKVEVNRWNRIIKTTPLDDAAKDILSSVNVKNKSLDDGLSAFVDEAQKKNKNNQSDKKDENENASASSSKIVIYIDDKKNNSNVDLSKFQEHVNKKNMDIEITKNGNNSSNKTNINKNNNKGNNKEDKTKGNKGKTAPGSGTKGSDKNDNNNSNKGNKK